MNKSVKIGPLRVLSGFLQWS